MTTRRKFLKFVGAGIAGAAFAPPLTPSAAAAGQHQPDGAAAPAAEKPFVLGPLEDIALIDQFTADRKSVWKASCGPNESFTLQFGYNLPAVASNLLSIDVTLKDPHADHGPRWFTISRDLPAGAVPAGSDGFRVLLLSRAEVHWWIQLALNLDDGASYSQVLLDGSFPAGRVMELLAPLKDLKTNKGETLTAGDLRKIRRLSVITNVPATTLYLDRITAYRQQKYYSWLDFTTSRPATNIFQRTDPVSGAFAVGGGPPAEAAGFRYEIRDFFGKTVRSGVIPLTGAATYAIDATPPTHGYYEVNAFFVDRAGHDIEKRSCLRAEGTVPAGLGTFSVLPTTVAENIERFKKIGAKAFFGLHGDFLGIAEAMGLAWRFGYTGWKWLEPQKPDRSLGIAPWAAKALTGPPKPPYRLHILPMRANLSGEVPAWAKRTSDKPPPFAHWDDYLAMYRDSIRLEKHDYPHLRPRIYGGAWEINLNMPPYVSQHPDYTPADVAELFRRTRDTVKAADPDGIVIGPCPSILDIAWFESVFKAGVLDYLDGIEMHGYAEGVFTPEENDYPGRIARLNALVKQFKGRTLPIYCTEAGQPGILGADIVYRSQAQRMTRLAIILKGEGVRVFLPFYGIDYDRSGGWGFCFNLEVVGNPWGTKRITPKPMLNAIAVCAHLLEGAQPRTRIRSLGSDVWAYVFGRDHTTITAIWTTGVERTVEVAVGKRSFVEVVNIMGHSRREPVRSGAVRVAVDASPSYVIA